MEDPIAIRLNQKQYKSFKKDIFVIQWMKLSGLFTHITQPLFDSMTLISYYWHVFHFEKGNVRYKFVFWHSKGAFFPLQRKSFHIHFFASKHMTFFVENVACCIKVKKNSTWVSTKVFLPKMYCPHFSYHLPFTNWQWKHFRIGLITIKL